MYCRFEFQNPIVRTLAVLAVWDAIGLPHPDDAAGVEQYRAKDGSIERSWSDWTTAQGSAVLRERLAWAYTCGGAAYWIDAQGLHFEGSRRSFANGSTFFDVGRESARIGNREFPISLVEWSSTVPGNPDPFEDWERVLEEHEELNAPPSIGELIEAKFRGWTEVLA